MTEIIRFGPSGNSEDFYLEGNKHSEQAPYWLKSRGLNAYEYSFGRGVTISDEKSMIIGQEAIKNGVKVSVHAPYYINFANQDEEMIKKSFDYLYRSAKKVTLMGGDRVIFHPATMGKMSREEAFSLTKERIKRLTEFLYENELNDRYFCIETMGKQNQIGTLEEIVDLVNIDDIYLPTIDFGHLNARDNGIIERCGYEYIIKYLLDNLPYEKVKYMHVHFSKIMYGNKGEIKHLTFEDNVYGPSFEPLSQLLVKYGLEPTIICESDGTQTKDSLYMLNVYNEMKRLEELR